ncbi:hypothetical protein RTBOTA2_006282 [Rhodotorula toruloides]|nr:hypothetical protein RTBOTA2_006282 [Rhodotorula toruloides]
MAGRRDGSGIEVRRWSEERAESARKFSRAQVLGPTSSRTTWCQPVVSSLRLDRDGLLASSEPAFEDPPSFPWLRPCNTSSRSRHVPLAIIPVGS